MSEPNPLPLYQQRVVEEKIDLDEKRRRLEDFITSSPVFQSTPQDEQHRLQRQLAAMTAYSLILGERIDGFYPTGG